MTDYGPTKVPTNRALIICPGSWTAGPVVFFRRACELLPHFGWNCKLVVTGSRELKFDPLDWPSDLEVLPTAYSWQTLAEHIADAIRRADPDIVIGCSMVGGPLAMRLLRSRHEHRARYLDIIHVDTESEYERIAANADVCDRVAGVSEGIVEKATRAIEQGCIVDRLYYPVPCPTVPPSKRQHGPLRIGYVGRLASEKRVLDFIPLLEELARRGTCFEFTFVGDGPERGVLEKGIRDALVGRVPIRFVGWLRSEQALQEVSRLDVAVMLSETEGQPIALLEAMSMAVVPVVTCLPGMRELIVDGENGFLAPVGAIQDFADRIEELASNQPRRARMGRAAWERVVGKHAARNAIGHLGSVLHDVASKPAKAWTSVDVAYPQGRLTKLRVPPFIQSVLRRSWQCELH